MKRLLLPLALAAAITVPVGAQFGWFSLNGGLIARMSSAVPAATIEQGGTGPILSLIRRGIGVTSSDGSSLVNPTAAAAGAQQYSPMLCQEGQGWKTDATAGSQSVEFCWEVQPVQGTTAPSGNYLLKASINGGAFSTVGTFTSEGRFIVPATGYVLAQGSASFYTTSGEIWGNAGTGQRLNLNTNGLARFLSSNGGNTYDITLADWGTTQSAEAVSVADAAVLTGPASGAGFLVVSIGTDNNVCTFALTGTSAPVEINDPGTLCSTTALTASSVNVYYSSGYKIENLRGGTRALRIQLIGG